MQKENFGLKVIVDYGADGADLKYGDFGYNIYGASNAVAEKYDIPEFEVRNNIIEGICMGTLRIRNKHGLVYYSGDVNVQSDRISIDDLNSFFHEQGVCYKLAAPAVAEINESIESRLLTPDGASGIFSDLLSIESKIGTMPSGEASINKFENKPNVDSEVPDSWPCADGIIERRITEIISILNAKLNTKKFSIKCIPRGMKAEIEKECLKCTSVIFTKDGFKRAWQKACDRKLLRVEKSEIYSGAQQKRNLAR